jgi:hypothetical protein
MPNSSTSPSLPRVGEKMNKKVRIARDRVPVIPKRKDSLVQVSTTRFFLFPAQILTDFNSSLRILNSRCTALSPTSTLTNHPLAGTGTAIHHLVAQLQLSLSLSHPYPTAYLPISNPSIDLPTRSDLPQSILLPCHLPDPLLVPRNLPTPPSSLPSTAHAYHLPRPLPYPCLQPTRSTFSLPLLRPIAVSNPPTSRMQHRRWTSSLPFLAELETWRNSKRISSRRACRRDARGRFGSVWRRGTSVL